MPDNPNIPNQHTALTTERLSKYKSLIDASHEALQPQLLELHHCCETSSKYPADKLRSLKKALSMMQLGQLKQACWEMLKEAE